MTQTSNVACPIGSRLSRRGFLRAGVLGVVGSSVVVPTAHAAADGASAFSALQEADDNGLRLPVGFTSRVVATSNTVVPGTSHTWHRAPDGGATFATNDGGWIYVSNAERSFGNGGVGALRFDADANVVDAYSILTGTNRNCAGGPTPWGTWLSCEETSSGIVYECDPFTPGSEGIARPAMGAFYHEAAAVDPTHQRVYMTEDTGSGKLYRFTPSAYPNLSAGILEVAEILGEGTIQPGQVRSLAWHTTISSGTHFNGGEGCWFHAGSVYFSTKGDHRVWQLDTFSDTVEIIYDRNSSSDTDDLHNVDNVYVSPCGDVYVAEDPGDLQIVALTPAGDVKPIVQLVGTSGTEITGPALSPDGTRLYFSSQRNPGVTYEVNGPFAPVTAVPALGFGGRGILATALGLAAAIALARAATVEGERQKTYHGAI